MAHAEPLMPGQHLEDELRSQPDLWARAATLTAEQAALPAAGARVAIVGCGTSWFMAQSFAALREGRGYGVTDAVTGSEPFPKRDYDAVIALSRSGTTTEVLEVLRELGGRVPTIGIIGDPNTPDGRTGRHGHRAAVRRRAIGGADQVRDHRAGTDARVARRESRRRDRPGPRRRRRRAGRIADRRRAIHVPRHRILDRPRQRGGAEDAGSLAVLDRVRIRPRNTGTVRSASRRPAASPGCSARRRTGSPPPSPPPARTSKTARWIRWPT